MCRFTAKFTTRKRFQDIIKVYNQETDQDTKLYNLPRHQQSVQPGKRYQDTNKVYNQETKVPTNVQPRKKVPS